MFHSLGTVQSKTSVPVATSWIVKGTNSSTFARLWRNPSPVMLRQMGNSSRISSIMSLPVELGADEASQIRQSSAVEIHRYSIWGTQGNDRDSGELDRTVNA